MQHSVNEIKGLVNTWRQCKFLISLTWAYQIINATILLYFLLDQTTSNVRSVKHFYSGNKHTRINVAAQRQLPFFDERWAAETKPPDDMSAVNIWGNGAVTWHGWPMAHTALYIPCNEKQTLIWNSRHTCTHASTIWYGTAWHYGTLCSTYFQLSQLHNFPWR